MPRVRSSVAQGSLAPQSRPPHLGGELAAACRHGAPPEELRLRQMGRQSSSPPFRHGNGYAENGDPVLTLPETSGSPVGEGNCQNCLLTSMQAGLAGWGQKKVGRWSSQVWACAGRTVRVPACSRSYEGQKVECVARR